MQIASTPRLTLITIDEARAHLQLLYGIRKKAVDKIGDHALRSESIYITNPVNYLRNLITQYELSEVHLGIQEPKWSSHKFRAFYLDRLNLLKKQFKLKPNIVYVPGHGNDISHIAAFHDSKEIISLEINPDQVNILRSLFSDEPNVKCLLGSAEDFTLAEKADLLIVFAAGYDENFAVDQVKPGGHIICSAYSHFDTKISEREDLQLLGTLLSNGEITSNKYEEGRIVESDAELKTVKDLTYLAEGMTVTGELRGLASYADVLKIVYFITGQTTNIVQRYKEIREIEIEKHVACRIAEIKERHAYLERIADVDELCKKQGWKRTDFEWEEAKYLECEADLKKRLNGGTIKTIINGKELELKPLPAIAEMKAYIFRKL